MNGPTSPPTVLLVDPDPAEAARLIQALELVRFGHAVRVFRTPWDAFDHLFGHSKTGWSLKHDPPTLLLVRVDDSVAEDIVLLRRIRRHSVLRYLPIVLLTESGERNEEIEIEGLAVNLYMRRPATPEGYHEIARRLRDLLDPEPAPIQDRRPRLAP